MAVLPGELNFDQAVEYHYGKFPPSSLDYGKLIGPMFDAGSAIARFDQVLKSIHNSELLLAPLRSQEAVISSRMEGTVSTMDEILQLEADHEEGAGFSPKTRPEAIETDLYRKALKSGQADIEAGRPISQSLMKALHQELLSSGRGADKTPGKLKEEQNYLVDRTKRNVLFVPVDENRLRDGLDDLFNYIESDPEQPLLKIAISHVEFEALHPFKDGNGRVGRMLITLMMWKWGLISEPHFYISGYFEEHKDDYLDALRAVSKNDEWTEWCLFFMKALEEQAKTNLATAEQIQRLYEEMKTTFTQLLASKNNIEVLDYVFTNPIFRSNKLAKKGGIKSSTAARLVKRLADNELLREVEPGSGRRAALYAFEPLLQIVRV